MDFTESELSISLQEALTYYLAFLSHTQKLRESKLPRQGKGVETTDDISSQRDHQVRVAASETCLQYTGRIARRVRRWQSDPEEPSNDDNANVEVDVEALRPFLDEVTEDSFVDPFSGKWIEPTNASSAGPSPSNDEAPSKRARDLNGSKEQQRPLLQRQQPYRKIAHDYLERKSKSRRSRPSLGLHPNAPISLLPLSPATENRSSSERSSESSIGSILTPATSVSENDKESKPPTSPMITVQHTPQRWNELDARDMEYARRLEADEKRRREQVERSYAEAKRLSERIAREEQSRLEKQRRYTEDLERKEREYTERMRRDRAAAEKSQAQWVIDMTAREAAAEANKRSEDRRRKDRDEVRKRREEDEKRLSEIVKKVRFGRERSVNEGVKKRVVSISDEKRRRDVPSTTTDHRRKPDPEKKEKEPRPKKVDCVSCMEAGIKKEMAVLACDHAYCGDCIKGAFKSAYKSHAPFKCCGKTISTANLSAHLSSSFIQKYDLLLLELSTKKPTYCASQSCSKFIPPSSIHGPIATCPTCKLRTCVACKMKEHPGICKEDKDGKKVEELAKKKGWKQCPKCSQILERTEGCLHMTCRCRAEWCYACLRDWDVCKSTCGRR
ncbi:uncharacterized protein LY89DRAFT_466426 [Mollisia scopiformis]|uniref:RBR-type E3 ubiquitin transferase n=1 Tax=Mollisia scopiformis TaxID=149040 RepID=A0A194XI82_MOLSC|nr:uncharacterized protein LY89DRAFT_466426 [Mollisia scopiformis]KUJ19930.1 hypothetical protein LY89DRAFT_466426 [Mollisia scopiformis]